MVEVIINAGDDFGKKLQEFKRKTKDAGILEDLRQKEFYRSPSEKRRFKRNKAIARRIGEQRKSKNRT